MKPVFKASFRLKKNYQVGPLLENDVKNEYVNWLNDPETNRFISTARSGMVTLASQKEYVRRIRESSHDTILGLFDSKNRTIGSSGIQELNSSETGPWIGVLIGPKECRGIGLGAALVWIVTYILFSHFNVTRVFAGMRVHNVGSYKTFCKVGYREHIQLTKKYMSKERCSKKVIVVSCSQSDLIAPENMGITSLQISAV